MQWTSRGFLTVGVLTFVAAAVTLGVAALYFVTPFPSDSPKAETVAPRNRVIPENVAQIKEGMPMEQVEAILGNPLLHTADEYLERKHGIKCIERISFGPTWAGAKVWIGDDVDIVVSYDHKGLVISTVTFKGKQRKS